MIDFDRFWAEPGCLPGLGKEQSDQYRQQMMAEFTGQGDPDALASALSPQEPRPGVTVEEIAAWERKQRVRLPDVLRQALAQQNGGHVHGTAFNILPLK